ncbi:MAG: chromate transporter, partial [Burkholderiaceae bacterium]|nr:chromate transporter [Burkholderiaceae bacterium]
LQLPFPLIVLAAGLIGYLGSRYAPEKFTSGGGHGKAGKAHGPALIDDHTPTPAHALFNWGRFRLVLLVCLGLWVGGMGALTALYGWDSVLAQMGWFFTKAALMTFGGAYAVLPYVFQGAVEHYQWLSAPQMIDGLALGETTPGPLIMVNTFVGFVGGWTHAVFGENLLLAGVAGALTATFFTFLPSFLFILAGGPLVESTRDNIRMTAPLTAISAAVVGVIVSLALFFGQHVFRLATPRPHWDVAAMLLSLAAAVALLRYKVGTIKLIVACALAGLVLSYLS